MRIVCYNIYHKILEEIVVVLECDRHAKKWTNILFGKKKRAEESFDT